MIMDNDAVCLLLLLQPAFLSLSLSLSLLDHNRTVEEEEDDDEGGNSFGRRLPQASTQAQAIRSQYVFWLDKKNTMWYLF